MTQNNPDLEQIQNAEIKNFCCNSMPYEAIDEFFIVIGEGKKRYDKILKQDVPIGFAEYTEAQQFKNKIEEALERESILAKRVIEVNQQALILNDAVKKLEQNQRTDQDRQNEQIVQRLRERAKKLPKISGHIHEFSLSIRKCSECKSEKTERIIEKRIIEELQSILEESKP